MGNPPFIGAKFQSPFQRAQVRRIAGLGGSGGTLDYVAAWFIKAGQYMANTPSPLAGEGARLSEAQPSLVAAGEGASAGAENNAPQTRRPPSPDPSGHPWSLSDQSGGLVPPRPQGEREFNKRIRIAFVSTNSITQGEQVAQLWPILFDRLHLEIFFAHRTFSWGSEAKGKAHVHVVIIGLTHRDNEPDDKRLFSYPDIKGDPVESQHGALTAYLFDAQGVANRHLVVKEEARPINGAGKLSSGSQPIDGGHLIFNHTELREFLLTEPTAKQFLRRYVGAEDFINGGERWILALQDASPADLKSMPNVLGRLKEVRKFRLTSQRTSTKAIANQPTKFNVEVLPKKPYLAIPEVSSERRDYIPLGWLKASSIPSNKLRMLPGATLWEFGVLTSRSHMAWTAHIGGRLKSDYQYGIGINYNTFPWPEATPAQRAKIETLAQAVLDARAAHPTSSLADLYDPDTMPGNLRKAHAALDLAVDRLYRPAPFASDRDRVEHLFGRYEALVNPLEREAVRQNKRISRKAAKPTLP
jgi:hypothetical protein